MKSTTTTTKPTSASTGQPKEPDGGDAAGSGTEKPEAIGKRLAAQVAAETGWKVTASAMSVTATKAGFAPVAVYCSSVQEAAQMLTARMTAPDFEPMMLTQGPPKPPPINEDTTEE